MIYMFQGEPAQAKDLWQVSLACNIHRYRCSEGDTTCNTRRLNVTTAAVTLTGQARLETKASG